MGRILETHQFGAHRVDVVEIYDDEGVVYQLMVDDVMVTDPPLAEPPPLEEIVRIYSARRA